MKLSYLELLLTGNDRDEEKKYLQHKHNLWAGGSLDVIDSKNGNIAVSLNVPEYFQDIEYFASLHILYFVFNNVTIICNLLKEECLPFSYMVLYVQGFCNTKCISLILNLIYFVSYYSFTNK